MTMKSIRQSLLPTIEILRELPEATALAVIQAASDEQRRETNYASLAMVCGTLSFLGCIGAFCYLVAIGHQQSSILVLGAGVLAIVVRMITARL
jgi:hypothetical protein